MILGKVVPAQGKPDLAEKAARAFRRARERREGEVRREQREADAAIVRAAGCRCVPCHPDSAKSVSGRVTVEGESHAGWCPVALAAILEGK